MSPQFHSSSPFVVLGPTRSRSRLGAAQSRLLQDFLVCRSLFQPPETSRAVGSAGPCAVLQLCPASGCFQRPLSSLSVNGKVTMRRLLSLCPQKPNSRHKKSKIPVLWMGCWKRSRCRHDIDEIRIETTKSNRCIFEHPYPSCLYFFSISAHVTAMASVQV